MRLIIAEPSREDLIGIWEYISVNNPAAADKLMRLFREKFELLRSFPLIGRERHEMVVGSRFLPVGNYIISYQSTAEILEIIRVRHGATNLDELFDL